MRFKYLLPKPDKHQPLRSKTIQDVKTNELLPAETKSFGIYFYFSETNFRNLVNSMTGFKIVYRFDRIFSPNLRIPEKASGYKNSKCHNKSNRGHFLKFPLAHSLHSWIKHFKQPSVSKIPLIILLCIWPESKFEFIDNQWLSHQC